MDTSRTINMVLSSLSCDAMAQQDKLERLINSNDDLEQRTYQIKIVLRELITIEQMLIKFQNLISENSSKK
jgi:hypothetical protein